MTAHHFHPAWRLVAAALLATYLQAGAPETVTLSGLHHSVEILRDRWGVPHIYASNPDDLFFAQGWITARDRLFQIDLWRRVGTGKLAEAIGPRAIERDRLARAVRYRGDWDAEWKSYAPDTKQIVTAFVAGINAYIRSLGEKWPAEFQRAGYGPGLWEPADCVARVAGLSMTRNLVREIQRARDVVSFGVPLLERLLPVDPPARLAQPTGLDLADITPEIARIYGELIGPVSLQAEEGSNNWVIDGTRSTTGKPLLAGDPHRPLQLPSLRKTVHLVAPGWNLIGAGEPGLPGVALGHNDRIAFAFTIVGIDQQDLYIEELNPTDPALYRHGGEWRRFDVERQDLTVKGRPAPHPVTIKYSVHGPVLHEDLARHRAYVLRWVGTEPGTAGYLASLSLGRAAGWDQFRAGAARFKVPSLNMVYADVEGNIGWQVVGLTPVRKNWNGLFPVPGAGSYEWSGFLPAEKLPHVFNPASHYVATANHNILPKDYTDTLGFEFAPNFRYERIVEMLGRGGKFGIKDFERMQQDVISIPARRFQAVLRNWQPEPGSRAAGFRSQVLSWNASLEADSAAAAICQVWLAKLPGIVFGPAVGARVDMPTLLRELETGRHAEALDKALVDALAELQKQMGTDPGAWKWGRLHTLRFRHPLNQPALNRGPLPRPGDTFTVNAGSGPGFAQANGASYRQIVDLADWDRSVMTNVPGESGDPSSLHYSDLLEAWDKGEYHPMPFTRKAVEAAVGERIVLRPGASQ
jgi:penicillin amidase